MNWYFLLISAYSIYSVAATAWQRNVRTSNAPPFTAAGVSAVNGPYMYYAGGFTGAQSTVYNSLFQFDASTASWTKLADLLGPVSQTSGAYDNITSTLYLPGGWNGTAYTNYIISYNTLTGKQAIIPLFLTESTNSWACSGLWAYNNTIWLAGGENDAGSNTKYLGSIWMYSIATSIWTQLTTNGPLPNYYAGAKLYGNINSNGTIDLSVLIGTSSLTSVVTSGPTSQALTLYQCHGAGVQAKSLNCATVSSTGPYGWGMFGMGRYESRLIVWGSDWWDNTNPPLSVFSIDLLNTSIGWLNDTPTAGIRPRMNEYLSGIVYNTTLYIYGGVDYEYSYPDADVVAIDLSSLWYPTSSTSTVPAHGTGTESSSTNSRSDELNHSANTPVSTSGALSTASAKSASTLSASASPTVPILPPGPIPLPTLAIALSVVGAVLLLLMSIFGYLLWRRKHRTRRQSPRLEPGSLGTLLPDHREGVEVMMDSHLWYLRNLASVNLRSQMGQMSLDELRVPEFGGSE